MNALISSLVAPVRNARVILLGAALSAILAPASAWACVGCRQMSDEVKRTEPTTIMAGFAFSWSVLFMLLVVGLLIGFLVTYMSRVVQRLNQNNQLPPE